MAVVVCVHRRGSGRGGRGVRLLGVGVRSGGVRENKRACVPPVMDHDHDADDYDHHH